MADNSEETKIEPNKMKRNHTFLTGMYMAVNAISDAFLIMDGPDCAYKKIELFEKNHDFMTKIFKRDGRHKISATVTDVNHVIDERHDQIIDSILNVASCEDSGVVFISSEPMVALTGVDYDMLADEAQKSTEKKIIPIPYQSLDKDWLDGYSYVLERIAERIDFPSTDRKKDKVAVIGHLFDRNEGDNLGNVREIERMLKAISLDPCSIWLSGSRYDKLAKAAEAEYIIKMPYSGRAADIIAERTGAKIIDVGIPFGFENTSQWLRIVATTVGRESEAEAFINNELKAIMPLMEWLVPVYFQGKRIAFAGDPHFASAFVRAFSELDSVVTEIIAYSTSDRKLIDVDVPVFYENDEYQRSHHTDYFVGCYNSREMSGGRVPFIEFGFPSHNTHFFSEEPYLGLIGFTLFLNRMINRYLSHESRR
ncbi:MAG: nitrogenase component 1 [Candidatus Woesearchaeota archaeon]